MMPKDEDIKAAREVANTISEFREEAINRFFDEFKKEVDELADSDFDPGRGRGRGAWWAD